LYVKEKEYECVHWVYVGKDGVNLRDFVKATNYRVEWTSWNILTGLANHETSQRHVSVNCNLATLGFEVFRSYEG